MPYIFDFCQQVLGTPMETCRYLRHSIIAETHLEAFAQWCALPSIQNVSMDRLGALEIEVTKAEL